MHIYALCAEVVCLTLRWQTSILPFIVYLGELQSAYCVVQGVQPVQSKNKPANWQAGFGYP